jgi:hypothetical protein
MQARTYHESQNKPTYVIREILQAEELGIQNSEFGIRTELETQRTHSKFQIPNS